MFFLNHALIKLSRFQGNEIYKELSTSYSDLDSAIEYSEDLLKVCSFYELEKDAVEYNKSKEFNQKWLNERLSDMNKVCEIGKINITILFHLIFEYNSKFLGKTNLMEELICFKDLNHDLKVDLEMYLSRIKTWKECILREFGSLDPLKNFNNKKYEAYVWHITSSEIELIKVTEGMNTSGFSTMKEITNIYFSNIELLNVHLGLLTLNLMKKEGLLEDDIGAYIKAKIDMNCKKINDFIKNMEKMNDEKIDDFIKNMEKMNDEKIDDSLKDMEKVNDEKIDDSLKDMEKVNDDSLKDMKEMNDEKITNYLKNMKEMNYEKITNYLKNMKEMNYGKITNYLKAKIFMNDEKNSDSLKDMEKTSDEKITN